MSQEEKLPKIRFNANVVSQEAGELYSGQSDEEEFEEIEVMVELFSDHPEVEGSLEIMGPRWRVREIIEELSRDANDRSPGKGFSAKPSAPIYQENPDETLTEVFVDVSKRSGKKELDPLQQTLVGVLDGFLREVK